MAKAIKLNGRAFAFIASCFLVVLMLALPTRALLQERREIAALELQITAQQKDIYALVNRQARFADPSYIKTLARARLNFVFPGEIGFVVLSLLQRFVVAMKVRAGVEHELLVEEQFVKLVRDIVVM